MRNADMSIAAVEHTESLDWQSSPSSTVSRKRLHLVGEAESGQVTSLVRYHRGAKFPSHPHPGGEEILVLGGVFSDETGDWPRGSYLLNPEGFVHAPFSAPGCDLLVKLRQYSGNKSVRLAVESLDATQVDNLQCRLLYQNAVETTLIVTLKPDEQLDRSLPGGCEGFVLEGGVGVNGVQMRRFDWFRLPSNARLKLRSRGCSLYLKLGAVAQLWSYG